MEIRLAGTVKDSLDYRHLEGRRIKTQADPALLAFHHKRFRERQFPSLHTRHSAKWGQCG
jgi:hypothetical protein